MMYESTACRKAFHHTNSEKKIALVLELFPVFSVNHDNSLVQQTNAKTQMQQLIGIELSF